MQEPDNLELHPLTEDDIVSLTKIMTWAFDHDTKLHLGDETVVLMGMMTGGSWQNGG